MANPSFEEALERLEAVVQELEKGELTLERALALYEEGVALTRRCQEQLDAAEGKLQELTGKGEGEDSLRELGEEEQPWT